MPYRKACLRVGKRLKEKLVDEDHQAIHSVPTGSECLQARHPIISHMSIK